MPEITSFPITTRAVDIDAAVGFELDAGNQSGSYQWALSAPQLRLTLTGDTTLTATGISNGRNARVVAVQDATGGHSLTFGSGFATAGGNQPAIGTAPGSMTAFQGFTSGGAVILDLRGEIDTSPSVGVQTNSATGTATGEATLNGELTSLVNADSADVYFEYREVGATEWIATAAQTLSETGEFNQALTGLAEVEYEFRANAIAGAASAQGEALTFFAVTLAGAVYTTDPNDLTTGTTSLPGFTQPWAPVSTQVVDLGTEKAIRTQPTSNSSRAALVNTAASSDQYRADSSIFVEAITNTTDAPIRLLARLAGASGSETAISGGRAGATGIRIDEYTAGAFATLQTASFNSNSIRMRMLMTVNGTTATLKAWNAANPEPATPQVTTTVNITDAGALGVFVFNNIPIDITFLSIATGEAVPERPA